MPLNISANVPISSSETIDSPIPPPIIVLGNGAASFDPRLFNLDPKLSKLKNLLFFFASSAALASLSVASLPALAPNIAPPTPTGATDAIAFVILPIV